jgi:four helix bundle suffix protein
LRLCAIKLQEPQIYELYREFVETRPPEVRANFAVCLINQTNYLIDQLLRQKEDFVKEGGLRERMTRARMAGRKGKYGRNGEDNPSG